jgi:peroxiredoxin
MGSLQSCLLHCEDVVGDNLASAAHQPVYAATMENENVSASRFFEEDTTLVGYPWYHTPGCSKSIYNLQHHLEIEHLL